MQSIFFFCVQMLFQLGALILILIEFTQYGNVRNDKVRGLVRVDHYKVDFVYLFALARSLCSVIALSAKIVPFFC